MKNRDYHKDVRIDPNNLESEWLEQGSNYLYYAEALADAIDTRDTQKQRLELTSAELDNNLRTNWDKLFPDLKLTETSVKSKILQDVFYKKALDLLNKANHNVNLLTKATIAFEHKKKALENLVSLKVKGIYSTPKIPTQKKGDSTHAEHTKTLNTKKSKFKKLTIKN